MRQRIVFITENNKNLNEVLAKYNITQEELLNKTKDAWEVVANLINLNDTNERVTIETVEQID